MTWAHCSHMSTAVIDLTLSPVPNPNQSRSVRVLRASRSTDDESTDEHHFRRAESVYCRGGGVASMIECIELHTNPTLSARWEAKRREYDASLGEHSVVYAFHGTSDERLESILIEGMSLAALGTATRNRGYYGAGLYFSETLAMAQTFCGFNERMLICKVLVGKPCLVSRKVGRSLEPGFTSHVSDVNGAEIVIFDEACVLPVYVVKRWRSSLVPTLHSGAPIMVHQDVLRGLSANGTVGKSRKRRL